MRRSRSGYWRSSAWKKYWTALRPFLLIQADLPQIEVAEGIGRIEAYYRTEAFLGRQPLAALCRDHAKYQVRGRRPRVASKNPVGQTGGAIQIAGAKRRLGFGQQIGRLRARHKPPVRESLVNLARPLIRQSRRFDSTGCTRTGRGARTVAQQAGTFLCHP